MEITLEQLLKGKGTIIKNKEYLPTRNYIEPFVDRMSKFTSEFICKAIEAPQLAREEDNKIYNRVWVQAVLPEEYAYENHKQSINILYALDKQKPIVKLFKNTLNMACLNMCVFSPEYMQVSELLPESAINFAFVKNVMEMTDNTSIMLKKLADTFIDRSNMYKKIKMLNHIIRTRKQHKHCVDIIEIEYTFSFKVVGNWWIGGGDGCPCQ